MNHTAKPLNHTAMPLVIDGPNFVNSILNLGIDHDLAADQLSLTGLRSAVRAACGPDSLLSCDAAIEFVCSRRLFGPSSNRFTQVEQRQMLARFMGEEGVHIEEVLLPGNEEKGVDGKAQDLLLDFASGYQNVALATFDRDFIPNLGRLRRQGARVILVGVMDPPVELKNEVWQTLLLDKDLVPHLFVYRYPRFDVRSLTLAQTREMISHADDRLFNRVTVNTDGTVHIATDEVAKRDAMLKFRFETFVPGNDYVGPRAASTPNYVKDWHERIVENWESGARGYID
jgi:hypothetical protein